MFIIHLYLLLIHLMSSLLMYVYLSRTTYNTLYPHLSLDYLSLALHYSLSYITYMCHDSILDLHNMMLLNYSMLSSLHLVLYTITLRFHLHHSSLCYMFMSLILSYPTYSAHYIFYISLLLYYLYFIPHPYIPSNMFMLNLLFLLY